MSLLRRASKDSPASTDTATSSVSSDTVLPKGYTPPKGAPTPKRTSGKAPVAPPPLTQREASKRYKGTRGTKEERRAESIKRRQLMDEGDERYLMPRDKGPVKAFVRDQVDGRRNLLGLLMPLMIVMFVVLLIQNLAIQRYATLGLLIIMAAMLLDGFLLGRTTVKRVRAEFPDSADRSLGLYWYAGMRASQLRKLRIPKPRVTYGHVGPYKK